MLCSGFLSDKWPFFGSFLSYVVHLISCSNSSDDDTNKLLYCISLLLARGTGYIIKVAVLILTTDTFPEPDLHLTQNFAQGREGRKNGWTFFTLGNECLKDFFNLVDGIDFSCKKTIKIRSF